MAQALVVVAAVLFVALAATAGQTEFRLWAERAGSFVQPWMPQKGKNGPLMELPAQEQALFSKPAPGVAPVAASRTLPAFVNPPSADSPSPQLSTTTSAPPGNEDSFWHQGKEYFLVSGQGWSEAEANARSQGGSLAKIGNLDLNQRLFRAFGDRLWIGLRENTQSPGSWFWPDGEPPAFTNWVPGQPDGIGLPSLAGKMCAQFWASEMGKWDDHLVEGDASMRGGIAEKPFSRFGDELSYPLALEIDPGDWGGSDLENIRQVALSAANQIWRKIRGHKLAKIKIRRGFGAPQLIFSRGPQGENLVELNSGSNLWAQIAYQFAHEFYHVLAATPRKGIHWFGEVLGETSSMFCLRSMARDWSTEPPYPNWKDYARNLDDYANALLDDARKARGAASLPAFIAANQKDLENYDREKMKPLAAAVLPIFESNPSAWESVLYGDWGVRPGETLTSFLRRWQEACPPRLQPFVAQISSSFQ